MCNLFPLFNISSFYYWFCNYVSIGDVEPVSVFMIVMFSIALFIWMISMFFDFFSYMMPTIRLKLGKVHTHVPMFALIFITVYVHDMRNSVYAIVNQMVNHYYHIYFLNAALWIVAALDYSHDGFQNYGYKLCLPSIEWLPLLNCCCISLSHKGDECHGL